MAANPEERTTLEAVAIHTWLKVELPRMKAEEVPVIEATQNQTRDETETELKSLDVISNPDYAYDTTLIPYLESMFFELPTTVRRSSEVERVLEETRAAKARMQGGLTEKLLRKISRSAYGMDADGKLSANSMVMITMFTNDMLHDKIMTCVFTVMAMMSIFIKVNYDILHGKFVNVCI